MMKIAFIQARMGASRFPGKVLEHLGDKPVLSWIIEAAKNISLLDKIVVVTSHAPQDQILAAWCQDQSIEVFCGSEHDVLARFHDAAVHYGADIIMRLTADCPFLDAGLASQVLHLVVSGQADYASNIMPPTWPDGLDCEVFTRRALDHAHLHAKRASEREHVTSYLRNHQAFFRCQNVSSCVKGLSHHRWTVDTRDDLDYLNKIVSRAKSPLTPWHILACLKEHPDLVQPPFKRNEGFDRSLRAEETTCTHFEASNGLLTRSLKTIPLGAQTFSKSHIQYPAGISPLFLTHGLGAKVWDVDGNEYTDLVSGLLPVVLGYNDPDVNFAIQEQLSRGISFSLSTALEVDLAETLCQLIPSAQKVRFGKNGTDVTSAAVRIARAYTRKDKVLVCGYHGWQDWSIGTTTRNKGVPQAVCALSEAVPYNDLERVETHLKTGEFACMVMEPCNTTPPAAGYLEGVKALCERHGALLIFDEVITGFRFDLGGAQSYFGVTPHLSCFGKAMGNGMPISAIVGHDPYMREMEDIFFSGTFGGETLSLAASLATLHKMQTQPVIETLWKTGGELGKQVSALITAWDLGDVLHLAGLAPWHVLLWHDHPKASAMALKTLFMQEMIKHGVLISSSLNVSFAHDTTDCRRIMRAFEASFSRIHDALKGDFSKALEAPAMTPLFKVR